MIKAKLMVALAATFSAVSCDTLNEAAKHLPQGTLLTNTEVIEGLKTALSVSTDTAVKQLHMTDGYFRDAALKILLPPEAKSIMDNLSKFPLGKEMVDRTVLALNRAAEDAAVEAAPIFKNAITSITFDDAMGILKGTDTAATHYLRNKTYTDLHSAFTPKIQTSLSKPLVFNQSAESLYGSLVKEYNKYSINGTLYPKIAQSSLSGYVTDKALQGLFIRVSDEEKKIRNDIGHRVTDVLRKVFAQQ